MIDRGHRLALSRQAELLGISRSSLYYDPCPVSDADLAIMRRIDELHLDYPFGCCVTCCVARASRSGEIGSRR
jgi:putative transposase